jgi:hypothetical protein
MKHLAALALGLLLALVLPGCGGGGSENVPAAPTDLTTTGELGKITLQWDAGTAFTRAQTYYVYRRASTRARCVM